jgi:hypothetical protein
MKFHLLVEDIKVSLRDIIEPATELYTKVYESSLHGHVLFIQVCSPI